MDTRVNMTITTSTTTPVTASWFYSTTFNHYQKVNQGVYAYVTPMMFGAYYAQLYLRGTAVICSLEVRTSTNPSKVFKIADRWLVSYADANQTRINMDYYAIDNPNGAWGATNYHLKSYWV